MTTNGNPLEGFAEQIAALQAIAAKYQRRRKPLRDPAQIILARDPETGERRILEAVTDSGIGIRYKPLTIGEARSYDAHSQGKAYAHWPPEEQVRLLNANLVEPDFRELAGGPLTVQWCDANFDWLSLIEMGTEILKGSRVDFRIPALTSPDEKKDHGRPTGSEDRSSMPSSTTRDTATSGSEASSD